MSPAQQTPHTVSSYDDDLHRLRSTISQMGALCEAQLTAAVDAMAEQDAEGAAAVIALDPSIDALHLQAEAAAIAILMRHAPLADDLREVVATLKIAGWLERVGDYAKTIAKRAVVLAGLPVIPTEAIVDLASISKQLLRRSLNAYIDRDEKLAGEVIGGDVAIDAAYAEVFDGLVAFARQHPDALTQVIHLQFVAKNLERIADQATNIAEQVSYAVSGTVAGDRFADSADYIPGLAEA